LNAQALFSVGLSGYLSAFMIAAASMLHKRLTTPATEMAWGPFRLGRAGIPITILALAHSALGMFFSMWPLFADVTPATMNYASLVFGLAILLSLGFWILHGRKSYKGPVLEVS
jgi:choline transport protein